MKLAALLLCALGVSAATVKVDDKLFEKQENLLKLFINVQQPNYNQKQTEFGNSFDIYNAEYFTNSFAIKKFQNSYKQGLLPRGDVFYYYNPAHLQQAIELFDVFYFAKDYDTFYKAACWARDRINEGQFVYALSVAIVKRQDTQGVVLPPQSEVYPYLYVNTRAVQLAQTFKQTGLKEVKVFSNNTDNYFIFRPAQNEVSNDYFVDMKNEVDYKYQPYQYQKFQEGRVAYFREDVYINQQFVYQQIFFPNWFNSQKYSQKTQYQHGERFYYYLQQLLARYNLERYTNGLSYVVPFQFNQNIETGYNPQLQYHDGQAVPARPNNINSFNNFIMEKLLNLDRRITDVIDSRQVKNVNGGKQVLSDDVGVEILGNIIQANENSVNNQFYSVYNGLYGYFDVFRKMVGSVIDPYFVYKVAPGVVENDSTALRDPIFYQIVSRIVNYFRQFKSYMKPYTQEQITFPGVEVKSVTADQLVTYFDVSEVELFNAINYQQGEQGENYQYKASQQQLNYKPFNYNIQVTSEQNTDAIVRVFIGPKYNLQGQLYTLDMASPYFVELDQFVYPLKTGQNQIQRSSQDSAYFVQHQPSTRALFTMAQQGSLYYNQTTQQKMLYTLPQHLLLPRGSEKGQEFMLGVTVHQHQQDQTQQFQLDGRPLGFPFDRQIEPTVFQGANNIFFKTVNVFHKSQQAINNFDNQGRIYHNSGSGPRPY